MNNLAHDPQEIPQEKYEDGLRASNYGTRSTVQYGGVSLDKIEAGDVSELKDPDALALPGHDSFGQKAGFVFLVRDTLFIRFESSMLMRIAVP